MPHLQPFRGLRYNAAPGADLSALICPPYDVISVQERELLLARDPRNAARLELPAATPTSATPADYERTASTLTSWAGDGTLARDARPMIYVYEQRFAGLDGSPRVARSFFCELELEEYGPSSGVRPHEHTIAAPREHRFQLLSAVRTHLSPVLLIYDDTDGRQASLLDEICSAPPLATAIGPDLEHRLWAVDPEASSAGRELLDFAARKPLTIADGHHRYETALRYRASEGSAAGADHVMALLFGSTSGGLALAPWHRIISGVADPEVAVSSILQQLGGSRVSDTSALMAELTESDEPGVAGVWSRQGGAVLRWQGAQLDVSVVSGTLPAMIGSTERELTDAGRLTYTHDAREAIAAVESGRADVCLLLRPTPIEQVMAVAAAGEFMPPKSTYFYPKAATGLVFDPLYE